MKKLTKILMTLVLVLVVFACVGCKDKKANLRENPTLADGSSVYYTLTEGDKSYSITKNEMYVALKKQYGATTLATLLDKVILAEEKDANGKSYMDLAADETNLKAFIDLDVYGENKDELTAEEKAEKEQNFLEAMLTNYGCNETSVYGDSIKDVYQITYAEKLYATDKLQAEYTEHMAKYADEENKDVTTPYFADSKYAALYNEDHASTYNVIIVPFTTEILAKAAEEKVGALTTKENFIDLYKLVNPSYASEDEFALAEEDIYSAVLDKVNELADGEYTATPYAVEDGKLFVYIYLISATKATKFDDLEDAAKDEIKKADSDYTAELLDAALTNSYILTKICELRESYELKIYDDVVEALYVEAAKSYKAFTESTEASEYVASIKGKNFTCEELFAAMEKTNKAAVLVDLLVQKRFAAKNTSDTDYDKALTEEKANFNNGTYVQYGYDPALVTWRTFLEGSYGVVDDKAFIEYKKAQDSLNDYTTTLNPLEQYTLEGEEKKFSATEEDEYWQLMSAAWEEQLAKYYSIKGVHVLVSLYEDSFDYANDGEKVPANEEGKWTEAQIAGAKELLEKLTAYLVNGKGTYAEKLDKFVLAYACAPQFASTTYSSLCTFTYDGGSIDLSSYKALGLAVIWQDLGTFTNGSMVEEFDNVAKVIWNHTQNVEGDVIATLSDSDTATADGITYTAKGDDVLASAIATKYGYHLFVETGANKLTVVEETTDSETGITTKRYLPTLAEIQDKAAGKTISSNASTAISKYYANYQSELKGSYFASAMGYNEILKLLPESDKDIKAFLDLYIDYVFENNLKYVTKDYLK